MLVIFIMSLILHYLFLKGHSAHFGIPNRPVHMSHCEPVPYSQETNLSHRNEQVSLLHCPKVLTIRWMFFFLSVLHIFSS